MRFPVLALLATLAFPFSMAVAGPADSITVEHPMGKTQVPVKPERVVVMGIGALDVLDTFGIAPVAVTKEYLPDYLSEYRDDQYATSGTLFEPDFEGIFSLKPDLIIIGPRSVDQFDELSKIAPTLVFAFDEQADASYWQATRQLWRTLGRVFAIEDRVEAKIAELDAEFNAIAEHNRAEQNNALLVMSSGKNITAFGAHSRFSALFRDFGFVNAAGVQDQSRHGELVSFEYIKQANPRHLFIIDRDKVVNKGKSSTHQQFDNALVKATAAYQNQAVTYPDTGAWYITASGVTATEIMISDVKRNLQMQ
ncbi:iron complex transport system substrate-binding protein [Oceanisphaera litoralis]|uniref:siderophore ABC transporter substrate-binding protein n=1 Tax=Oceanisphaera litoralis TaxID=225144 RepID=UPI001EF76998|nr:ABC transporter substrate-binding protein [Oceanisphaera litoralis]MBM7455275.1 iron complex transport system substrate-binding protein [Oceanisphaera litoralis]